MDALTGGAEPVGDVECAVDVAVCESALSGRWIIREVMGHLHPTPSRLRVTAANSAVTGEMVPVANKSSDST